MRSFRSVKDLRLFLRRLLKEELRGLPPDFRIEVEVLSVRPPRALLRLPVPAEGNLPRAHQLDLLVARLLEEGLSLEVFYADDLPEAEELLLSPQKNLSRRLREPRKESNLVDG